MSDGESLVKLNQSLLDVVNLALAPRLEKQLSSDLEVDVIIRCAAGTCKWSAVSTTVYPGPTTIKQIETICGTVHTSVMNAMRESPPRPLGKMLGLDVILKGSPGIGEHWWILNLPNKIDYWRRR
jgi:hypothetical protein